MIALVRDWAAHAGDLWWLNWSGEQESVVSGGRIWLRAAVFPGGCVSSSSRIVCVESMVVNGGQVNRRSQ